MSKKKIHIEDLCEQAEKWWNNIPVTDISRNQNIIVKSYMKANNIKEIDINY